jgi:hypothetical protein
MTKTTIPATWRGCFEFLNLGHLYLFRVSIFEFRIYPIMPQPVIQSYDMLYIVVVLVCVRTGAGAAFASARLGRLFDYRGKVRHLLFHFPAAVRTYGSFGGTAFNQQFFSLSTGTFVLKNRHSLTFLLLHHFQNHTGDSLGGIASGKGFNQLN